MQVHPWTRLVRADDTHLAEYDYGVSVRRNGRNAR